MSAAPHIPGPADVTETVAAFEALRADRAALDARELRVLAGARSLVESAHGPVAASSRADVALRSVAAELAATTRTSERTVRQWIDDAADLMTRFEGAVDALERGWISRAHVRVLHEAGAPIVDDTVRAQFVERMVRLGRELTPAGLRQVARIAVDRALERGIDERHTVARSGRRVRIWDLADGMSELSMVLPSVLAHAIYERVTADSRSILRRPGGGAGPAADEPSVGRDGCEVDAAAPVGGAAEADAGCEPDGDSGDERTMDQVRADVACDLLLTGSASTCAAGEALDAVHAIVQISVPVLTLVSGGEEPAVLAGSGPIDLDTARRLAGAASGWERVMTSPLDGAVLAVDRYTPTSAQKRMLRARDEHCRFPGCRQPVHRCDVDHTLDHARGGATRLDNLAHLCRHHHTLKHATAWTVEQRPRGVLRWTSPSGRVFTDRPEPTVRFVPADPPGRVPEPPPF